MKQLITLVLLLSSAVLLQARPEFSSARPGSTPYDEYMGPVSAVLRQLDGRSPSFSTVATLVKRGFGFKYVYDTPYLAPMPSVTESLRAGDCKAKSLWLADRMNDPSVRYVIGKARRDSRISHAWLMWKHNNQWWILDPTNSPSPILASRTSPDEYLITYSYDRNGSYRHNMEQQRRAVAGRDRVSARERRAVAR